MTDRLRVAVAQTVARGMSARGAAEDAAGFVARAVDADARLVVFPELAVTGWDVARWNAEGAVGLEDDVWEPLVAAASAGVTILTSAAIRRPEGVTLSAVVVAPRGSVTAPYDKQHLSGIERDHFVPGDHGASLQVDGWQVGLGICYDSSFPSHARAAAQAGADVYACPSAFYRGSEHRRDLVYPARALDNALYVVFAGAAGSDGHRGFSGGSAVYDPEGRPLVRAGSEDDLVLATLNRAELERARTGHEADPVLMADRRSEVLA